MRFKTHFALLLISLFAIAPALLALAQDQNEEGVRGAFLTSRPTTSVNMGGGGRRPARRRPPRQRTGGAVEVPKNVSGGVKANVGNTSASVNASAGTNNSVSPSPKPTGPLALGYTLYTRDPNGDAVRVDPSREFRAGDRVRIALETNSDGYLYVFHTENDGQPEMIYPDQRLDEGDNFIEAHVPTEIPSSKEQDERFRWFVFDNRPANERLYIVLTREPLPVVPTGEDLVKYCRASQCPWRPSKSLWDQVRQLAGARVRVVKEKSYGQAQTAGERDAATRGLGLVQSAPPPSVIRMNVTSDTGLLVTSLDLIHK
ncbi:MAG TPA: DUF4384 domain-containing protein [Pyrinomonadaceae bacterium]